MSKYVCKKCNFKSNRKTDYTRHIETKKHLSSVTKKSYIKVTKKTEIPHNNHETSSKKNDKKKNNCNKLFTCNICESTFTRLCSLKRHRNA